MGDREIINSLSGQDETSLEAESFPWMPGERQAALAEVAAYNALFPEDLDLSQILPESDGSEFNQLSLLSSEEEDPLEATCPLELC